MPRGGLNSRPLQKWKEQLLNEKKKKYAFNRARAADLPHAKETPWHWATEAITKDAIYLNSYTQSEILDEIKIFAMPKENSVSKSRKKNSKFIFFRIWSLDFSSFTSYGFLLPKGRTPNSQKSARISIYSKLISDSVTWVPGQFRMGECHPLLKINRCLGTHGTCTWNTYRNFLFWIHTFKIQTLKDF